MKRIVWNYGYLPLSLQCVFHGIRFKVNKGWSTAVLLFLCLIFKSLKDTNQNFNKL